MALGEAEMLSPFFLPSFLGIKDIKSKWHFSPIVAETELILLAAQTCINSAALLWFLMPAKFTVVELSSRSFISLRYFTE